MLAVFFDTQAGAGNEDNSFIEDIFTAANGRPVEGLSTWLPIEVSIENFLAKLDKTKMFHYEGSLTTPPCT